MIICFSGTGNSRFVADALAHRLGDEVVSLNDILRNDLPREFESEKPYVFVFPVYAWNIPPFVREFMNSATLNGCRKVYAVVTMGADSGKTDENTAEIMNARNMEFMGLRGIVMTDNYINFSPMPDAETVKATNARALLEVDEIAEQIRNGGRIVKTDRTRLAGLKSGFINRMFTKHMSDPGFTVSEACTGCGACERFCPSRNITLTSGKPVFDDHCFCCYGCLHRCPVEAINIKGKSEKRGRFVCPEYDAGSE